MPTLPEQPTEGSDLEHYGWAQRRWMVARSSQTALWPTNETALCRPAAMLGTVADFRAADVDLDRLSTPRRVVTRLAR